jgi:hypothetical protein
VDNANNNNSNDRSLLIKRIINMKKESKYITVLDFEVGEVYQYEFGNVEIHGTKKDISEYCEEYLSGLGHNLKNCEWMLHKNPEIITP